MLRSRSVLLLLLVVGTAWLAPAVSALAEENTLTEAEKKAGWKLLFDGKSADEWRNFKSDKLSDGWKVKDGELIREDKGAGSIVTKKEYGSFELSIEYKISEGGNSGIMFHVSEDSSDPPRSGPEVQIQDNVKGHDPQKSGWLYQLYQPSPDWASGQIVDATAPVGQWNHIQLLVTPVGGEVNMNGIRYSRFVKGSDDWNARVAKSKFAKYPEFGKAEKGHLCLQDHGNLVSFRNIKIRELGEDGRAPEPIDGTLPLKVVEAFPDLKWAGWEGVDDNGRVQEFRPIVVTHAGDGSNRIFVATQQGVIYSFENNPEAQKAEVFLDIRDRVTYKDSENEEGLLGFAFHPQFRENGTLFIFYTTKSSPHTGVISRFTAKGGKTASADTEEEIFRIPPKQFWNHNGGTLAFGPDGYLYIGLGDGGAANDPYENAQNMGTILGKILRIDVDHKDAGKAYAIPKDNPFVGRAGVLPEIYASGLRNVWRMAFDRKTGLLWCADVGQNLWEEIDIIVAGGNYGWNLREGTHQFGPKGSGPRADLIEPIWQYDHQVGLSITGGLVYRGSKVPELAGKYLYADYVTGKVWALKYDERTKKVVSNESIPTQKMPVITFGDDEQGEVYFTLVTANGKGIYKFENAR